MDKYFINTVLLQNTLLPYFCEEEPLKFINKLFYKLNYEKYNTHLQPHGFKIKDSGAVNRKINYKNGKRHGLSEDRWIELDTYVKCNYKNDNRDGLYKEYLIHNNMLLKKCNYKNDELDGIYEVWFRNGQLYERSNYKNGKLDGLFELWNHSGELTETRNYKNNKLVNLIY